MNGTPDAVIIVGPADTAMREEVALRARRMGISASFLFVPTLAAIPSALVPEALLENQNAEADVTSEDVPELTGIKWHPFDAGCLDQLEQPFESYSRKEVTHPNQPWYKAFKHRKRRR